jgi:hypothetical protein
MSGLSISGNSFTNNRNYGLNIDDYNGAFRDASLNSNCFSGNGVGAVFDTRRLLTAFQGSGCGSVAQPGQAQPPQQQTQQPVQQQPAPAPTPAPAPQPAPTPTPAPTPAPAPTTSPRPYIRANAGGGQYNDPRGNRWDADFGFSGGYSYSTGASVSNTDSPQLFQTMRWNSGVLDYSFNVTAGTRVVILRFAEIEHNAAGQRRFDVWINGQQVLSNYDVFAIAGKNVAHDRSFVVSTSGPITVHMEGRTGNPAVCAIEVR